MLIARTKNCYTKQFCPRHFSLLVVLSAGICIEVWGAFGGLVTDDIEKFVVFAVNLAAMVFNAFAQFTLELKHLFQHM